MDAEKLVKLERVAKKVSKAWRRWHKTPDLFPSDELIAALHDLDEFFQVKVPGNGG